MRGVQADKSSNTGNVTRLRDPRSLGEGYMEYGLTPGEGRDEKLTVDMKFTPDAGGGRGARKTSLDLDLAATSTDSMRYSRSGSTGNVGYQGAGHGAGVLVLVADKNKGLVALDLEAAKLIAGEDPSTRELKTSKELAQDPKIRAFAKAGGIDLSKLSVSIDEVKISAGFTDKALHTVGLDVTLSDGRVTQKGEFSALLRGDLSRGLGALTMSRFEPGLTSSAGWLYRPSDMPGSRDVFVRG